MHYAWPPAPVLCAQRGCSTELVFPSRSRARPSRPAAAAAARAAHAREQVHPLPPGAGPAGGRELAGAERALRRKAGPRLRSAGMASRRACHPPRRQAPVPTFSGPPRSERTRTALTAPRTAAGRTTAGAPGAGRAAPRAPRVSPGHRHALRRPPRAREPAEGRDSVATPATATVTRPPQPRTVTGTVVAAQVTACRRPGRSGRSVNVPRAGGSRGTSFLRLGAEV